MPIVSKAFEGKYGKQRGNVSSQEGPFRNYLLFGPWSVCLKLMYVINADYQWLGTLKALVKYEEEYPGSVNNILDGIKSGRLKFCPAESSPVKRLEVEKRLQTLFAERRHSDHCKVFLGNTIPRSSKKINCNDIQNYLAGLSDGWSRSKPSTIGISGKADAIRVSIFLYFEKKVPLFDPIIRPACMQYHLWWMNPKGKRASQLLQPRFRAFAFQLIPTNLVGLFFFSYLIYFVSNFLIQWSINPAVREEPPLNQAF
jgi:hypothetical protein